MSLMNLGKVQFPLPSATKGSYKHNSIDIAVQFDSELDSNLRILSNHQTSGENGIDYEIIDAIKKLTTNIPTLRTDYYSQTTDTNSKDPKNNSVYRFSKDTRKRSVICPEDMNISYTDQLIRDLSLNRGMPESINLTGKDKFKQDYCDICGETVRVQLVEPFYDDPHGLYVTTKYSPVHTLHRRCFTKILWSTELLVDADVKKRIVANMI